MSRLGFWCPSGERYGQSRQCADSVESVFPSCREVFLHLGHISGKLVKECVGDSYSVFLQQDSQKYDDVTSQASGTHPNDYSTS